MARPRTSAARAGRITDLHAAILRYNHSEHYVAQVLAKAATYGYGTSRGDGTLAWPVVGRIASPFGMRFHPILHVWRFHAGIDISASAGTPIRAPAPGTVTRAGGEGGCGYSITLEHGGGLRTRYCHLSHIDVAIGQFVAAGRSDRRSRLHRTVDRPAPALRGLRQRPTRRPAHPPPPAVDDQPDGVRAGPHNRS